MMTVRYIGPKINELEHNKDYVVTSTSMTHYHVMLDGVKGIWIPKQDLNFVSLKSDVPLTLRLDDSVNHPSHYTSGNIEVIDAIEDWNLDTDFYLANCIKYIARAGKKDSTKFIEDLKKAQWYLNRKIQKTLEKKQKRLEALNEMTKLGEEMDVMSNE